MEMNWISVKDKLPIDMWKEQSPKVTDFTNTVETVLAIFIDQDITGKIWDKEVYPVIYSGKDGWCYYVGYQKHDHPDMITHWMPYPKPI